jgi:hypothetical protein
MAMNTRDLRTLARILRQDALPAKTQWMIVSAVWLIALAVVAFTGFVTVAHAGEDVTMTMGRLGYSPSGSYLQQNITITNNTAEKIQYVSVNCGFFRAGQLVDTGTGLVSNVQAKTDAYTYASVSAKTQPDSVKCRIDDIR